jgi:glyoxylase-like metal-dependent hydrolase (beta-lactamase superfamily II)
MFYGDLEITPAKVDITFKDKIDLTIYGVDATAIHSPGHSKGTITILFNSGVTFIGDQLRKGKKGLNLGMFYDEKEMAIGSIKAFKKYNLSDIYLSHGAKITKEQIKY